MDHEIVVFIVILAALLITLTLWILRPEKQAAQAVRLEKSLNDEKSILGADDDKCGLSLSPRDIQLPNEHRSEKTISIRNESNLNIPELVHPSMSTVLDKNSPITNDKLSKLESLAELYSKGLITREELSKAKEKILIQ
jgi:hypothetical protein